MRPGSSVDTTDETADQLLEAAHMAAYRFPVDFAGFTATMSTHAGEIGLVKVTGRGQVAFESSHETADGNWASSPGVRRT